MFKKGCSGNPERSISVKWPLFFPTTFHNQLKASYRFVWTFDKCCIFWNFHGEKGSINGQTCRNLHMVFEVVQTWHGYLPRAFPPTCKSWDHFKKKSKTRPCSMVGVQVHHKALFENMFFDILEMDSIFFHGLV